MEKKAKVMTKAFILRLNEDTIYKLEELRKLSGLYSSKSQVIRSAIHRLYNEKSRDGEIKKDIWV